MRIHTLCGAHLLRIRSTVQKLEEDEGGPALLVHALGIGRRSIIVGCAQVRNGDPKVRNGDPKVRNGDPKVQNGDPKVRNNGAEPQRNDNHC
eukprot:scaffold764_cov248-Pinguiococcus_pyrenoidosus.AAC.22